jgi:hypothetical protein
VVARTCCILLELLLEGAQPTLHLVTLRGDAGLLAASGRKLEPRHPELQTGEAGAAARRSEVVAGVARGMPQPEVQADPGDEGHDQHGDARAAMLADRFDEPTNSVDIQGEDGESGKP